jgi:septal ring-binding cell division protein DamX
MSYDLSFDRKTATLLAICTAGVMVLLVAAGFLLGTHYRGTNLPSGAVVPAKASLTPVTQKSQPTATTAPALVETAASVPSGSLPAKDSPAQPIPPALPSAGTESVSDKALGITGYSLQFGAFREEANAVAATKQLLEKKVMAEVVPKDDAAGTVWYTVRLGNYPTLSAASAAAVPLRVSTHQSIFVRPANRP